MLKEHLISYDPDSGRAHNSPRQLFLELSSRCNLSCVHCSKDFGSEDGHPQLDMPLATLERLTPWLARARFVNLNMVGESLLSPHFSRALELCRHPAVELSVNTNGLLLTRRRCEELVDRGVHSLTLSIDGTRANDAIRGVSYEHLRERAELLQAVKDERGSELPHLGLAMTLMRRNLYELPELLEDFLPRVDVNAVHLQPLVIFYETLRDENIYEAAEVAPVLTTSRAIAERHGVDFVLFRSTIEGDERHGGVVPARLGQASEAYGCIDPFYEIKVRSTGEVMSCSYGRMGGLDVNTMELDEIWNGDWYRALRRDLYAQRFPGECEHCPYVFGCAANQLDHVRPGVRHSQEERFLAGSAPDSGQ